MAVAVRYYITANSGSYIDWSTRYVGFDLSTNEMQLIGAAGADSLSVQSGASVDATNLGIGNNTIYLAGSLAEYAQSIDQTSGVYTFSRQVGARTEVVKVLVTDANDTLYFADGHIIINAAQDARLYDGTLFHPIKVQWLQSGGTLFGPVVTDAVTGGNVAPITAVIEDKSGVYIPALTQPGQTLNVVGGLGVDSVMVGAGTVVDATNLGMDNDRIYLLGKLAEYSQSIDQDSGIYTLTRPVGGVLETIKFLVSDQDDQLFFADGHVTLNGATDIRLFDGTEFKKIQIDWLSPGGTTVEPKPAATPTDLVVSPSGTTLSGSGEVGSTVTVKDPSGATIGTATVGADGKFSVPLSPVQNDGQLLNVVASDVRGTSASAPASATAPDTTPAATPTGLVVAADGSAVTGSGEVGSTVTVKDPSGATIGTATVGADGKFSVPLSPVQNDGQSLSVSAADGAVPVRRSARQRRIRHLRLRRRGWWLLPTAVL